MKKGIGSKLSLYGSYDGKKGLQGFPEKSSEADPVPRQETPIDGMEPAGIPEQVLNKKSVQFGEFQFDSVSEGVLVYRESIDHFQLGAMQLRDLLPAPISSILELSLLSLSDIIVAEDLLFLDTETTGLTRGVGNIPFLTGLGWFSDDRFHLELYFLQDPGDEDIYLDAIVKRINEFPYLVSYNGKSFDIPVLKNRIVLNRTKNGALHGVHFDLLHIFRRLIPKGGVSGYRQKDLEEELLQFHRKDDIPGEQIPQIYFDYLKYDADGGLGLVFKHNRLDVLGMAFLFLRGVAIYSNKEGTSRALRAGIAKILYRNRKYTETIDFLSGEELLEGDSVDIRGSHRYQQLLVLAFSYRKLGDWDQALRVFEYLWNRFGCEYSRDSTWKILEHRRKDPELALEKIEAFLFSRPDRLTEEIRKRKDRLARKIAARGSKE